MRECCGPGVSSSTRWGRRPWRPVAGRCGARTRPAGGPIDAREPFPPATLVADFLAGLKRSPTRPRATGLSRDEYVRLIDGMTTFFAACQDERGAIIDPYEKRERRYLHAGLRAVGRGPLRVEAESAACCRPAFARWSPPVRTWRAARPPIATPISSRSCCSTPTSCCAASCRRRYRPAGSATSPPIVPEQVYVNQPASGRPLNNWNLVAAAGEHLRCREGYGRSEAWVEASLARQAEHFTPAGMYRDPNDPMAYDHFARLWALDLVEEGYAGAAGRSPSRVAGARGVGVALHAVATRRTAVRRAQRPPSVERGRAGGDVRDVRAALRAARRRCAAAAFKRAARLSRAVDRTVGEAVGRAVGREEPDGPRPPARLRVRTRSTRSTTCSRRRCWRWRG